MFCPNCGAKNKAEQNFCRGCGLKLEGIVELVSDQFPSSERADVQRRKERFEKLGMYSLSIAGLIGFIILLFKVTQLKLILFGPDLLGTAVAALIAFLLLSLFLIHYPKFFLQARKRPPDENPPPAAVTANLLEDRPSDYVSSVTEDTTRTLKTPGSIGRK